ncbi:hypothetical protein, partial [Methylobacterium sp. Leaf123]|uniref:hypothetical protein n=1 Tax=Methylobacterium sp. Leaf123 TaxID=1736264 RepID=UPI001AEBB3BF
RDLLTILACDETLHPDLQDRDLLYQISAFSHSLDRTRTLTMSALEHSAPPDFCNWLAGNFVLESLC